MAESPEELERRLERIERLLTQHLPRLARPAESVSELRSPRSIAGRLDDLWVAVTEGNQRLVATVEELARRVQALEDRAKQVPGERQTGLATRLRRFWST